MKELITKFYNIINRRNNCCYFALAESCAELAENEAIEFADWIANNYYGRTSMGIWRSDNLGFNTQELFKLYKDERKEKLK